MTHPPAVAMHELSAGHGPLPVLHGLTATFPAALHTAVLGPNGSGKTTLLSVIAGVHAPSVGRLERAHAGRPALVVQRSAVPDALPVTVREAVRMGRWAHRGAWRRLTRDDRRIAEEAMDLLGVAPLAGRLLGELSGGQRQRVLVAQGVAQRSDLLLLDEPTAGLDDEARESILALIDRACARGVTVVHATHDPEAAARADSTLTLHAGTVR